MFESSKTLQFGGFCRSLLMHHNLGLLLSREAAILSVERFVGCFAYSPETLLCRLAHLFVGITELSPFRARAYSETYIAMANLAMWVRDHYFPASYAHATWQRLVPFFQLPGVVISDATTVRVELCPFNDRALNRDLASLCERVNKTSPHLPDGRRLCFTLSSPCRILPASDRQVA